MHNFRNKSKASFVLVGYFLFTFVFCFAAEESTKEAPLMVAQAGSAVSTPEAAITKDASAEKVQSAVIETDSVTQNVTLDFKEADIRNVLKIISYKAGVNIVTTPEVVGNITIRLTDVPWDKALDVILRTYGYGYEKQGNIITVAPIDKLTAQKRQEVELAQVQPTLTEVFNLKYIDAQDAKKALESQLSPRGKITVLELTTQAGWEFGSVKKGEADSGTIKRKEKESVARSKILIISDVPPVLDKIREVIAKIDIKPRQVLIESRILEVNRDKLKDIGIQWGTGSAGADSTTIGMTPLKKGAVLILRR